MHSIYNSPSLPRFSSKGKDTNCTEYIRIITFQRFIGEFINESVMQVYVASTGGFPGPTDTYLFIHNYTFVPDP